MTARSRGIENIVTAVRSRCSLISNDGFDTSAFFSPVMMIIQDYKINLFEAIKDFHYKMPSGIALNNK
ncbi:MAG: hypothetical protein DRP46_09945 [Candidatus Zixiibacteriota bacterium]|nr:MAG: hypothetical protein DRP46_09945 [candidate division Zixibacteria bacterium]